MPETIKADVCVIGAGSGGLSVAAGASQMGAKVVLLERGKMGSDCLNYGCVPSKALIAAAHPAQDHTHQRPIWDYRRGIHDQLRSRPRPRAGHHRRD